MAERIPQDVLEKYLWDSAKLLRTNIDAGSYKQYIFPLLFFKRLCDVFDEKKAADEAKYGADAALYADDYLFKIPEGAHWRDVRGVSEDVGEALVRAFKAIENENPDQLTGIFGDAAWTNKKRLPDRLLKDLIEHFSSQTLSLARCPEDELGKGYEYLIKQFADDSGHTAQEFYTNRTVVALMTEMLRPKPMESIYDPTCGSGGMLISAIKWLKDRGEEYRNVRIYGQEINAITSSIARMNLFLHGIADFHIVNADTLKYPAFVKDGKLQTFDMVLANPPYSISQWDRTAFEDDKWGRNFLGTPPQSRADYAFVQHILKSLDAQTGRCAILLPHGVLFRNEERDIREKLVKSDLVEAVIGLAPNLFFNSPMESCILICRTDKPKNRRGKILFVNAVKDVERKNTQSYLTREHIGKIAAAYRKFGDQPEFAHVASTDEIAANDFSLNIPLYVRSATVDSASIDVPFEVAFEGWIQKQKASSKEVSALSASSARGDKPHAENAEIVMREVEKPLRAQRALREEDLTRSAQRPQSEEVEFGAVARECRETTKDTAGRRIVGLEHLDPEDLALTRWDDSSDNTFTKVFRKGQVLFGRRRAYLKKAAVAPFDGICSGDITVLEAIPGKLDPDLLPFIVQNDRFFDFAVGGSASSLSPRVKWEHLAAYTFSLPPLAEQKKLAETLWAMERVKRAYKSLLAQTDRLIHGRFIEMFGDPVRENRFPCNKVMDLLEKGATVTYGIVQTGDDFVGGVPVFRPIDITGELPPKLCNLKRTDPKISNSYKRTILTGEELLITVRASIGDVWLISKEFKGCNVGRGITPLRFDTLRMLPRFALYLFQFPSVRSKVESLAKGITLKNLNMSDLKELPLLTPPLALQREFAAFIAQQEKAKASLKESLAALTAAQKALMNQVFKGVAG